MAVKNNLFIRTKTEELSSMWLILVLVVEPTRDSVLYADPPPLDNTECCIYGVMKEVIIVSTHGNLGSYKSTGAHSWIVKTCSANALLYRGTISDLQREFIHPSFFPFLRRTHWDLHSSRFWKLFPGRGHPLIFTHLFLMTSYTHRRRSFPKQTTCTFSTGSKQFSFLGLDFLDLPVNNQMHVL